MQDGNYLVDAGVKAKQKLTPLNESAAVDEIAEKHKAPLFPVEVDIVERVPSPVKTINESVWKRDFISWDIKPYRKQKQKKAEM